MKNKNGIYIIGVDHGYGNIKTANCCFPTGIESAAQKPHSETLAFLDAFDDME